MASWKKYFSAVPTQSTLSQRYNAQSSVNVGGTASGAKYASYLPEVYSGAPNRVERYVQYEQMDLDSEINKALDILADYSTQNYEQKDEPFNVIFKGEMSPTEAKLLRVPEK